MSVDLVPLFKSIQATADPSIVVTDKVMSVPAGSLLKSLKPLLDEYRTTPELRAGTTVLTDLDSFVAWTKRHADADSVVFAHDDMTKPELVAVIDHDRFGPESANERARFGRHRGTYAFPLSREWLAWIKAAEEPMGAADFAAFFEERIADVQPPPYIVDGEGNEAFTAQDPEIRKLVVTLGKRLANVPDITRLMRGIEINVDARAVSKVDRDTGEHTVEFAEANGEGIDRVKPPNAFLIAIPVVKHGPLILIAVHLRYRASSGRILWTVEMHQPDRVFEQAFEQALRTVEEGTGLKPLRGIAPAAR